MANEEQDPLIQALPPATDYLTYLTLLEYQLTPARLPILHEVLQDETLTTNIGWDLVQLLLPMLPASEECLQDVARLGNPREVILRVSDALMKLEEIEKEEEEEEAEPEGGASASSAVNAAKNKAPLHILQFHCLLSMLSVLHGRIKTKYPSRFVATSLQAALEAYTEFPTAETTAAVLEFLRDMSAKKRPALPPRNASEELISRTSGASAPDPEAETQLEGSAVQESALIQRLVQFGLVEVLKIYVLHCTDEAPAGMNWAIRLQEKFDSVPPPPSMSRTEEFSIFRHLKERDTTIGKLIALSRDFGLTTSDLLEVVMKPSGEQPAPLDFQNTAKTVDDIPLERHGCLILLAARYAAAVLLGFAQPQNTISIYPDVAYITRNFLGSKSSPFSATHEAPIPLVDSVLGLAAIAIGQNPTNSPDEERFTEVVLSLAACTCAPDFRALSRIERIPSKVFHSNSDEKSRYKLIKETAEVHTLAREPGIRWLKEELVAATTQDPQKIQQNIFTDPESFSALFTRIYQLSPEDLCYIAKKDPLPELVPYYMNLLRHRINTYLTALNLFYFLIKSTALREQLQLSKLTPNFQTSFLIPLKQLAASMTGDSEVTAKIEMEAGADSTQMCRSAGGVVAHLIDEIEEVMGDLSEQS